MSIYTVEQTHPLASARTRAVTSEEFDANVTLAEILLGLHEPALTGDSDVERLQMAIIQQINFQIQQGLDALIEESSGISSQATKSVVWRDTYLNPRAMAIVQTVIPVDTSLWIGSATGQQSARTNDDGGYKMRRGYWSYPLDWPPQRIR